MKDGLERAIAQDAALVACVHADGQYSPEVLPFLAEEMTERGLDILARVSRSPRARRISGGMPIYKYAANALLNRIENHTLGLSMTDYHSGYLLYGRRALANLPYRAFSDSFDFDLEVIARARARGLRVGEAPSAHPLRRRGLSSEPHHLWSARPAGALELSQRSLCRRREAFALVLTIAAAAACHVGSAKYPWPAGDRAPATHAEVHTLNEGYDRTEIARPRSADRSPHARNPRLRGVPRQFHDRRPAARAGRARRARPRNLASFSRIRSTRRRSPVTSRALHSPMPSAPTRLPSRQPSNSCRRATSPGVPSSRR